MLFYRPEDLGLQEFLTARPLDTDALRRISALLRQDAPQSRSRIAQLCGLSRRKTSDLLNLLEEAGAVTVEGRRRAARALPGRMADEATEEAARVFERRRRVDRSRIEMMRGYAETPACRRQYLLAYLASSSTNRAGGATCAPARTGSPPPEPGTGTPLPRPGAAGPMRRTTGCATRSGVRAR